MMADFAFLQRQKNRGILTWPNEYDQMNMTKIWWRWLKKFTTTNINMLNMTEKYTSLMFVVDMVWSNSTLRCVVVKKIYCKYIFWSCSIVNGCHCKFFSHVQLLTFIVVKIFQVILLPKFGHIYSVMWTSLKKSSANTIIIKTIGDFALFQHS